jgi:hypothetical protein
MDNFIFLIVLEYLQNGLNINQTGVFDRSNSVIGRDAATI